MAKLIIAAVAEKGGGKGLFVDLSQKLLPDLKIQIIRSSDFWREILRLLSKEISRENIDRVATAIRNAFNDDGVLIAGLKQRAKTSTADIIVIDGLRKAKELEFVKEQHGVIIYIVAKPEIRFQRRKENVENADERDMTFEQFIRQDTLPSNVSIRAIGETMADVTIENNGTVEEFEAKIKEFLRQYTPYSL